MRTRVIGALIAAAALALPMAAQAQSLTPVASAAGKGHGATAVARHATNKFHSLNTAQKSGFGLLRDKDGIACISMPGMGTMGVHYVNGDRVGDPAIKLRQPEALVYAHENGKRRLVALEYVVLKQDWDAVHGKNAPRPRLYGHDFNKTPAGNRFGLPTFYSLHAWIWKHNPAGRFTMFNPNVNCRPHAGMQMQM
jgi:hypothetical protein